MNPNRAPDYYNNMNMNFPSLSQANPSQNYSNNLGQNLNLPKTGNMQSHPTNEVYGQNQNMYGNKFAGSLAQRTSLSTKLNSQSKNFVPSSYGGSGFGGSAQQQQQPQPQPQPTIQQSHDGFSYPQNFQNPKSVQLSLNHPQMQQQNIYPSNPQYISNQNQAYPPGFLNPNLPPMGGTSFFQPGANSLPPTNTTSFSSFSSGYVENDREFEKVIEHIANLKYPDLREEALGELSRKRESFQQLAVYLWHSVGTLAILLQEIVAIYPLLSPQTLSQQVSYKVCNVLGLLQCLALHQETRALFLSAHIPLFLYPFLNTSIRSKPFENLRVTSLGVIGALVKGDDSDAIDFLMKTEIIPLCLRIMKKGQELSRTVATFIVQKILLDDHGLSYICFTAERFFAVCTVLNQMVTDLIDAGKDDQRLLRHIIRCYRRLAENPKANEALRKYLPPQLRNLDQKLITDDAVRNWHAQLLQNLGFLETA